MSDLVFWNASSSFPDVISRDTGIEVKELPTAMEDRDCWREIVLGISPKGEK